MLEIEAYTNADWAGSISDQRSTFGYCTFLGGNLITWRSKKQLVVARSSAKAESRSLALGICELIWLKSLMQELMLANNHPLILYCDNKVGINIAHNPIQHNRTKHGEVDRHFIKKKLENDLVCMTYISFDK